MEQDQPGFVLHGAEMKGFFGLPAESFASAAQCGDGCWVIDAADYGRRQDEPSGAAGSILAEGEAFITRFIDVGDKA